MRTAEFVAASPILHDLLEDVQLARGRIYLWRGPDDLMARITPLSSRAMLLESPRRNSWTEHDRGPLARVLRTVEQDTRGTLHGLGSLVAEESGDEPAAQVVLHR